MIKVISFPLDANPYQQLLHGELQALGTVVESVAWPTPSHTVNLLLLPWSVVRARLRGASVFHLHWLYPFRFVGMHPVLARVLASGWFRFVLATIQLSGFKLVWTAHNLTPHERTFRDDLRTCRALVATADAVVVHSIKNLNDLKSSLGQPRRAIVAPHGHLLDVYPGTVEDRISARRRLGLHPEFLIATLFGRLTWYKGIEELLEVWPDIRKEHENALLRLVGRCDDPELTRLISDRVSTGGGIEATLAHVPDREVSDHFAATDLTVLPFRRITTSGSAMLAAGMGRALLVPGFDELADLPPQTLRYRPGVVGLRAGLLAAARLGRAARDELGAGAREHLRCGGWQQTAHEHHALYCELVDV